ncbi:MAG: ATP-binding protein [bacterium]|jgi:GTPase SAR1 family protein
MQDKKLKIAFIGTHGVGKTTLCYELAAHLKRLDYSVDFVKEVARECPLPINQDTTLEAQSWILHTQIAREIAAADKYQAVICDRSVLDNYAYLVHQVGQVPEMEPVIGHWLKTYTLLVKVPIWEPPRFDGTRDLSETFQAEIDRTIDDLIGSFDVDCLRLDSSERMTWLSRVLEYLDIPLSPPQLDLFAGGAKQQPDTIK